MAKWSDLPLELKEHIINMADDMGYVREGYPKRSGSFGALCAFLLVSREAWQLAARILWQNLAFGRMSVNQLQAWRKMSARIAPFVRCARWSSGPTSMGMAAPNFLGTFLEISTTLSSLVKLEIPAEGRWPKIASVLPSEVRERIEDVTICSGGRDIGVKKGSSWDAAVLVQGFPLVRSLRLGAFDAISGDDGAPTLIAAIQSLRCLVTFTSWICSVLNHSSLSNKWQGPVAHYD